MGTTGKAQGTAQLGDAVRSTAGGWGGDGEQLLPLEQREAGWVSASDGWGLGIL